MQNAKSSGQKEISSLKVIPGSGLTIPTGSDLKVKGLKSQKGCKSEIVARSPTWPSSTDLESNTSSGLKLKLRDS